MLELLHSLSLSDSIECVVSSFNLEASTLIVFTGLSAICLGGVAVASDTTMRKRGICSLLLLFWREFLL